MTLAQRRLLYGAVFAIFFIAAPLLIFYAAGYRYDLNSRRFTTVGAFYIKSYPAGSYISIDGKRTQKRTPNRILNVLPGLHTVTVSRDGFIAWQKQLEVKASETTFVRDVVLFKQTQDPIELSSGGTDIVTNADESVYAYLDSGQVIHLTSITNESDYVIESETLFDDLIAMSPAGDRLLASSEGRWFLIDVNTERATPLTIRATNLTTVYWDPTVRDRIWALDGESLVNVDLMTGVRTTAYTAVQSYLPEPNRILLLTKNTSGYILALYQNQAREPLWTRSLETTEPVRIEPHSLSEYRTLRSDRSVWIVSTTNDTIRHFDATMYDWHGMNLLYGTPYEVSLYNAATGESHLIDRSSETFSMLLWHPSGSYFVWQRAGSLALVETDSRDVRNVAPLSLKPQSEYHLIFNKKGSKLFVIEPTRNMLLTIQ